MAHLAHGLILFILITAVGFWILSRRGTLGDLRALGGLQAWAIGVGCLQALLDQLLGGLRIWVCARALGEKVALWPCTLANAATVFMGGVTPSQHGGGPAQIWILWRHGMRFTRAGVTSFCNYLGTVFFFLVLAVVLTHGRNVLPMVGAMQLFTGGTVILFALTIGAAVLALLLPGTVIRVLHAVLRRIPRLGPRLADFAGVRSFEQFLLDYSALARRALRRGKLQILGVLVLSGLIYLNKFLVAWVALRAFGLEAPVRDVLYLAALQSLITYFAPTPGGSGVAEVTAAELMRRVVPDASLGAYVVLWRFLSLYVAMALGAGAMLHTGFATLRAPHPRPDEARPGTS